MLKGKNINLRTIRSKDLDTYFELASDIAARGLWYPLRFDSETTLKAKFDKDGLWSDDAGTMLVVEKATDRIVGIVVHFKPVHYYNSVELGYILFKSEDRGKGFMTEAVAIFSKYLFDLKPIYRIQIQAEADNVYSCKVAERCGFQHEGTMRQAFISRGEPRDIEMYALVRSEMSALPLPL